MTTWGNDGALPTIPLDMLLIDLPEVTLPDGTKVKNPDLNAPLQQKLSFVADYAAKLREDRYWGSQIDAALLANVMGYNLDIVVANNEAVTINYNMSYEASKDYRWIRLLCIGGTHFDLLKGEYCCKHSEYERLSKYMFTMIADALFLYAYT
jgi:hypothetical protein